MTFLGQLNRDIVDTNKALSDMNDSMAIAMQESKKWTIVSRFLSGTGLWAIQNKLRGLISVFAEYQKSQMKTIENQQKVMELSEKLTTRKEDLRNAQIKLTEAMGKTAAQRENSIELLNDEIKDLKYLNLSMTELENRIASGQYAQSTILKYEKELRKLRAQEEILIDTRNTQQETLEGLNEVYEEAARIAEYYGLKGAKGEKEALKIAEGRLKIMNEQAKMQANILTGGKTGKAIQLQKELREQEKTGKGVLGKEKVGMQHFASDMKSSLEKILGIDKRRMKKLKKEEDDARLTYGLMSPEFAAAEKETQKAQKEIDDKRSKNMNMLTMQAMKAKIVKGIEGAVKNIFMIGKMALMASFWFILIIGIIGVIVALVIKYREQLEPYFKFISDTVGVFLSILMPLWAFIKEKVSGAFTALQEGKPEKFITELLYAVGGVLLLAASASLALAITAIIAFGAIAIGIIASYLGDMWEKSKAAFVYGILMVIGTIMIVVGLIFSWPVVLLGLGVIILGKLFKWFAKSIGLFSSGGTSHGGMALVGEKGPELMELPAGTKIHSNEKSRRMVSGGSTNNNITVNVQGRVGASDAEIRDIARKVGAQLNREINRTTSSATRS